MNTMAAELGKERQIAQYRMKRAQALAKLIREDCVRQAIEVLNGLDVEAWQNMAIRAGINAVEPPSDVTRGMTIELIKDWK